MSALPQLTTFPTAQPPAPAGIDFIPIDEAARRSGWVRGHIVRLCAGAKYCGKAGTLISRGLAELRPPPGGKGKPVWWVREDADPKFARVKTVEQLNERLDIRHFTPQQQTALRQKELLVLGFRDALDAADAAGRSRGGAADDFAARHQVKRSSLYLWLAQYRASGRAGLIDERWKTAAKAGGGDGEKPADDQFLEEVKRIWMDQRGRSKQLAYDRALDAAKGKDWQICSYKTATRFLARLDRRAVALHRGGEEAFTAAASCITRDYTTIDSNELWVGDHHRFDVMCVVGHDADGKPKYDRPWLTAWLDMRSRVLVGWRIYATHDPNADEIVAALDAGIVAHAAPFNVLIDNGKDYDAYCLQGMTKRQRQRKVKETELHTGVFVRLGIGVHHAKPYRPQSKTIERFFRTVCDRFSVLFETYCGRSPEHRPADLYDRGKKIKGQLSRGKAPTVEELAAAFGDWLEADYHHKPHLGDGMNGRSPADVFAAELRRKRVLDPDLRRELMLDWSQPIDVARNGVTWRGLAFGRNDPNLLKIEGKRKVYLGVDKDDLSCVRVYDAEDHRWICNVAPNRKLPVLAQGDEKQLVREAIREQARDRRAAKKYHEVRPRLSISLTERLHLKAAEQATSRPTAPADPPSLVPVRSSIEDQLPEIRRSVEATSFRTAVGSESAPLPSRFVYARASDATDPDDDDGSRPSPSMSFREFANRASTQETEP